MMHEQPIKTYASLPSRVSGEGYELVPLRNMHPDAMKVLDQLSLFPARFDVSISKFYNMMRLLLICFTYYYLSYMKIISISVQMGIIEMMFKARSEYRVMHY